MRTGKSTVKEIFDGTRIFNVPIYQRSYSWEVEDNLKDFFADIVNQHPDRTYFLGSFLFHIQGQRNEFTVIDVVDGQQRLTTFLIFINILIRNLLTKGSSLVSQRTKRIFIKDDDVFKFETSNEDSSFLHNYILSRPEDEDDTPKCESHSQDLMLQAKTFFTRELEGLELNTLEKLFKTSTQADVLLYVVDKINSATQIFELLNDRGRKLTDLEALKSFLMYSAGLVSKNPDQIIKNIQTDFAGIYRKIEKHQMNDSDVLRYHTIAFEGCPADLIEKSKEFLKLKVSNLVNSPDSHDQAITEIQNLSTRLKKSFDIFSDIQEEKETCAGLSHMFMIGRVAPFYPLLMRAYASAEFDFNELLARINRFTFRASLVGLRSNGESYLYTSLRNNEDFSETVNSFIQDNWWNINQRSAEVVEYDNYYEWIGKNTVRYILFAYENSLRQPMGYPLLSYKEYFTKVERQKLSIEHISAQRAKEIQYDDSFNERHLHSLGNLVIDFVASNSSKSNKNTADKKESFKLAPVMSQNEIDNDHNIDWRDIASVRGFIETREKRLKEFIRKHFDISEKTQQQ